MNPNQLDRYSRQILLKEIGGLGQRKLLNSKILILGAGGLGSASMPYLVGAGVGVIGIVDNDRVEISNLQRQVLFTNQDVGKKKVDAVFDRLKSLNSGVVINKYDCELSSSNCNNILKDYDLILDGTDNFKTRHISNLACSELKIPLVSAAISQWEGQVTVYYPSEGYPCFNCIFPIEAVETRETSCLQFGVVGPLVGSIGSIMATETIKIITGSGQPLYGEMLIFDSLWNEIKRIKIFRRANCEVCSKQL